MEAVLAVITEQGLSPTPVAVFAAALASLQHADTRQSAEVRSRRAAAASAPRLCTPCLTLAASRRTRRRCAR